MKFVKTQLISPIYKNNRDQKDDEGEIEGKKSGLGLEVSVRTAGNEEPVFLVWKVS